MSDDQESARESPDEIHVVGINTDLTRQTPDSESLYRVCINLSQPPAQMWQLIFRDYWKTLLTVSSMPWAQAAVEGSFLYVDCQLKDVALLYFDTLKKAVLATNNIYRRGVQEASKGQESSKDPLKKIPEALENRSELIDRGNAPRP